jgi:DNA-directed RNA polymerase subunit L
MLTFYVQKTETYINVTFNLDLMELNVIKDTKKELVFEIKGLGHTFCNILKESLYKTKGVEAASYTIDHPLINIPKFIVVTNGDVAPKDAVLSAIKTVKSKNTDFVKLIEKVLK